MKKLLLLAVLCLLFFSARAQTADTVKHPPLPANGADPDHANVSPVEDSPVFTSVQSPPRFPGGMDSLHRYLSKNIVYPSAMLGAHNGGPVIVSFVVEKNGTLTGIHIYRSPDDAAGAEVLRVFNGMKWLPGSQNKHTVRVMFTFVVKFDPDMPGLF